MTLVELCAGSAAVALRYLDARARPPIAWMGGKRLYAEAILRAMGLAPGGGRDAEIVLVEPGPWGEAWERWRRPAGRADTIERLRVWTAEDPRALWERLRAAPVPADAAERVAAWAALQAWSYGGRPVRPVGSRWRTHGVARRSLEGRAAHLRRGDPRAYTSRPLTLSAVADAIAALPDLSRVRVLRCSALEAPIIPGARYYFDPPYAGAASGYGHELPRAEVLTLAQRLEAGGAALVCVSEAEPLPLPGWHERDLGASSDRGWTRRRREVLTSSSPLAA